MRTILSVVAAVVVLGATSPSIAGSHDHIVTAADVNARVADVQEQRARRMAVVDAAISSAATRETAARVGIDIENVRRIVPTLSDAELNDLASRAAALETDPVAGGETWVYMLAGAGALLIIIIIIGLAAGTE